MDTSKGFSNICVQYKYNLFSECSESYASQLYMRGYNFWVCGEQILKRSSATGDRTQCLVYSHKPMKPKCTWIFIWIKIYKKKNLFHEFNVGVEVQLWSPQCWKNLRTVWPNTVY